MSVSPQESPKKIMYELHDVFPVGKGSSRRTRELLKRISHKSQYQIELVCKNKTEVPVKGEFNYSIHRLDTSANSIENPSKRSNPIQDGLAFRRAFYNQYEDKLVNYSLIQSRDPWVGVVVAKNKHKKFKFIYEVNGIPSIEIPYRHPTFAKKNKKLIRKLAQNEMYAALAADHIVVVSEVTKQYLVNRGIFPDKISVIRNGVNFDEFQPNEINFNTKRMLYHNPLHPYHKNDLIIGYIGAFQSWQGLIPLVKCLKDIINVYPNTKLVLAGKSRISWRKSLRNIVKEDDIRDHLIMLRETTTLRDIPTIINSFDICIAPLEDTPRNTVMGCNPIKLYEYGACAKPIIVSDLPVTREIFSSNIVNFAKPPNDHNEFSEEVLKNIEIIVSSDLDGRGAKVYDYLLQNDNSWDHRAKDLMKLYQRVFNS